MSFQKNVKNDTLSYTSEQYGASVSVFTSFGGTSMNSYTPDGKLVGAFGAVGFDGALEPETQKGGLDSGLAGAGDKTDVVKNINKALASSLNGKFKPTDLTVLTTSYGSDVKVIGQEETAAATKNKNGVNVVSADSLITDKPDQPIACVGADAPPIIIRGVGVKTGSSFLAIVPGSHHGLAAGVLQKTLDKIDYNFGINPEKFSIDIGPGLGPQSIKKPALPYNAPDNRPSCEEVKHYGYSQSTMEVGISTLTNTMLHKSSNGLPIIASDAYDILNSEEVKNNMVNSLKSYAAKIDKGTKKLDELDLNLFADGGEGFKQLFAEGGKLRNSMTLNGDIKSYIDANFSSDKMKEKATSVEHGDFIFKQHAFKSETNLAFDVKAFAKAEVTRKVGSPDIEQSVISIGEQNEHMTKEFDTANVESPFYGARRITPSIDQDAKIQVDKKNKELPAGIDGNEPATQSWYQHTGLGRNIFVAAIVDTAVSEQKSR